MSNNRSSNVARPDGQKRRWEGRSEQGPPVKRVRPENGHFQKTYAPNAEITLPSPPPALPPISTEYEKYVFTHPGTTLKGHSSYTMTNYDRLEFLGDAYIEIIASKLIFDNYETAGAGSMCRLRESVVKNETLSRYTTMYGLDKRLNISELPKEGVKGWTKIYGDVFEAYAAAVVLSDPKDGYARLETWLKALWAPVLHEVKTQIPDQVLKAKEDLARKVMCGGVKLNYVEERKPVLHMGQGKETFFVGVYLDGWGWKNQHLGSGEGKSKVAAGQQAALKALDNHPLIDEIIAKREAYLIERAAGNNDKTDGKAS